MFDENSIGDGCESASWSNYRDTEFAIGYTNDTAYMLSSNVFIGEDQNLFDEDILDYNTDTEVGL